MADDKQTRSGPGRRGGRSEAARLMTTVFISNLHCSSCVQSIRAVVESLDPPAELLSHSIISHSIVLQHESSLLARDICAALEREGFEIHSSFAHERTSRRERESETSSADWQSGLEQAVARWKHKRNSKMPQTEGRRRHVEQCRECQVEAREIGVFEVDGQGIRDVGSSQLVKEKSLVHRLSISSSKSADSSFVKVVPPAKALFKASISITGMTCSACVNSITQSLKELEWVQSADVNLITASASVTFADRDRIDDIVNAIEDSGFEAVVSAIDTVQQESPAKNGKPSNDKWKASYAIEGMTCSSCVGNVTSALERYEWVDRVDVNLLSNSATVWFSAKNNLPQIQEAIESSGYDASLNSVVSIDKEEEVNPVRSIDVAVSGLYCHHCPTRISDTLNTKFGPRVKIEKHLSLKDPIIRLSYVPSPPELTIRHVMSAVEAADSAFKASIYHPPTLEDRAREVHRREKMRYLLRLLLSVIVAIPTFLIGIVFMDLVPSDNSVRMFLMKPLWVHHVNRSQWALFILSTPVYFFAADIFHRRALKEIRAMWRPGSRTPISHRFFRFGSMNMLMSLGTTIAYFSSIAELAMAATGLSEMSHSGFYFDSVVFLTMFLMMGRYLEAYSKAKTGDAVSSLGNLRPKEATMIDEIEKVGRTVSVDLLEIGDTVRIPHGASPPFDGVIITGTTKFEESSLTGESMPVSKAAGDTVYSGTINKGAAVSIRLTTISGSSMLDKIIAVVREGQTKRAPVERVADKITSHFVPFVIFVAVSTWIIWLALGKSGVVPHDWRDSHEGGWELWSLRFAIAVFVIACPCGIGLAAPTALFVGGGLAARHGILVKGGGEAFQEASALDCIVFDKTGTLTEGGDPAVTDFEVMRVADAPRLMRMVMAIEENSSHPIAKALVSFTKSHKQKDVELVSVDEIPGKGLRGVFRSGADHDQHMNGIIGNEALMKDFNAVLPSSAAVRLEQWKREGKSVALLATDELVPSEFRLAAIFAISDPIRPEAYSVISALQKRGISVWMLTGDNPTTAKAVGSQLRIPVENIIAGVLPNQKAEKIRYLQRSLEKKSSRFAFSLRKPKTQRATVAMIGDGINDSPALSNADVSIAIGSGSDIAVSSAHFILINSNLTSLLVLADLSRKVFRRVWFNFGWALVYNIIAMPVAAGAFYPIKTANGTRVKLDPVWASLAMALSSLSVVCSSLLLRSRLPGVGFRAAEKQPH